MRIRDNEADRHGGAEHRYWVQRLADHLLANGYRVTKELSVGGGKTIDLVAERDGKRTAFEIETGKSNAGANVRKCLEAGMDQVVVVPTSALSKERIEPTLPNDRRVTCVTPDEALAPGWLERQQRLSR